MESNRTSLVECVCAFMFVRSFVRFFVCLLLCVFACLVGWLVLFRFMFKNDCQTQSIVLDPPNCLSLLCPCPALTIHTLTVRIFGQPPFHFFFIVVLCNIEKHKHDDEINFAIFLRCFGDSYIVTRLGNSEPVKYSRTFFSTRGPFLEMVAKCLDVKTPGYALSNLGVHIMEASICI